MKKIYTLFLAILALFLLNHAANAQCNPNGCQLPSPEPNAQDACILPSPSALDCYFGATWNSTPVSFPPSWCTTIENNHFFAFTADSPTEVFEMCCYGCAAGGAIQAAVLSTADCINFQFVSPCLGNIGSGTCQDLIASNLVVGQNYYLMIDGSAGALCDYSINGVNPTINGPQQAPCLPSNLLSTYTTNTPSNWTLNPPSAGVIQGNANGATTVDVQWLEPGPAQICAQSILCPNAPNLCIDLFIGEDVESDEYVNMCQGQTVECAGATLSSGGNHNVILQSYLGCDSTVHCHVTVIPTVHVNQTHRMCQGGSATCAGEEFFAPGNFPVTLTNYQGCDSIVHCNITVVPTYISPTKFINLCHPSTYTVCGNDYSQTGIYAAVCTGFLGCDSIVNIDLAVMDPIAKVAVPAVLDCGPNAIVTLNGTTSNLNSATGGVTLYEWQGPGIVGPNNQPTCQVNQPGQYCLILKHGRGGVYCNDTACVTVTASAIPPGANATGGILNCVSSQTTLMGSSPTSGVTYTWTGPGITPANQFQQNPTVNQLGVYVLTVFNPVNGCTSTASFTVNGNTTIPSAAAVGDTITCFQPNVTIDGITDASTATWNWAGPGITPANQSQENPNVLVAGTYTVTVTNTVNFCTNTASVTLPLNTAIPTVSAGPNDTLTCTFPNITLQGSGNGGGQPISFSWAGPNGFNSNVAQPSVNVPGTYILTVLNTLNGCLKKDTVDVGINQIAPNANAGADSTINCAQPSVSLIGSASSNGANFTPTWSGPGINAGNMNQYNPVVDQPGNYTLLITNTANGCTATDQVLVDINTNLPSADAGTDQQLTCTTPNGVVLNGNGSPAGITYLWSGPSIGAHNETQQNPSVTQAGTYDLTVTDPVNGCTDTDQVIVTQDANVPVADGGPDFTLNCSISVVDFDGSLSSSGAGIIYTWSGPGISGTNINAQSPTGLTLPGTYHLTVTNTNNNCENTDIVVIQIDTIHPIADAGNQLTLNCFNNATDTLDASGSSLGSTYTLLWSGNGINAGNQNLVHPVISNLSGTYTLVVTNTDNTCTATDQVNIVLDTIVPTADAGVDRIVDCVVLTAVIGGSSSSGPNFSYLWTGPGINASNETLLTPTVDQVGTYQIVVTNNINGCTASNDVAVNTTAAFPTVLAGNDGHLTCANTTATLDGSASSSGANFIVLWTGPGINAGNQNQPAPVVTVPGTYVLQITDNTNSCVETDTVVVTQNITVPAASAGLNLILDCLTMDVTLDGSQSGTGPTITYTWTGAGINGTNQNDQSPNVNQPGTYDLVVTDTANGCSDTDQVVVTQDIVNPTADAGADGLITCAQQTETIDGSGSSTGANIVYVWQGPGINSNNVGVQSPTVNQSGTYTVTVTNNINHCTATDVVIVNLDENAPPIVAGPDAILTCTATTVQLDATQTPSGANISFNWSGPGIAGSGNTATPTINLPGQYILTVTDANNGCTSTDIALVTIDTISPIVFAGSDLTITCANSSTGVTLSSTGSSTGVNFAYLWTGPGITPANETSPNPTVLVPGTYTLQITNNVNGCVQTDDMLVNSSQNLPIAAAGPDRIINCAILEATLDGSGSVSPSGGTLTFQWDGPGINGSNDNEQMPVVLLSGTYSLTVTNIGTGCSATDQVIVSLDTQPAVPGASSTQITCTNLQSNLSATSSVASSTYLWSGPDINPNNAALQNLQVDVAGVYTVTVTAPNGCTSTATTEVTQDADVPQGFTYGTVLNCLNNGVSQIGGEVTSPANATFNWTGPGIVGTVNTPTVQVTQAGTYTFTIFSPNGCVRPITAEVVADFAKPTAIAAAAEQIDCNTPEVTLNATASSSGPNYTFAWSTTNGHFVSGLNSLTPTVDVAGTYQLVVTNLQNGCTSVVQVPVAVDPDVPSGFNLTLRDVRCYGDVNGSITVNGVQGGTPPFIYTLSNATGVINQYTGLAAGQYLLALQDANGCKLDTTITIDEPGQLQVELGPDVTVSLGEYATVSSQVVSTVGIQSATWNYAPGCTDSTTYCHTFTYRPFDTYRHRLTVVDSNGCEARDEVLVIVQKPREIYVPNVFNPNTASNYFVTVFAGIDVAKINSFYIYDRWGDEVFEALNFLPNDPAAGWDGKVKGQAGQLAVYVWYCEVEFIDGETKLFKGDVTLVR